MDKDQRAAGFEELRIIFDFVNFIGRTGMEEEQILGMVFSRVMASSRSSRVLEDGPDPKCPRTKLLRSYVIVWINFRRDNVIFAAMLVTRWQ